MPQESLVCVPIVASTPNIVLEAMVCSVQSVMGHYAEQLIGDTASVGYFFRDITRGEGI